MKRLFVPIAAALAVVAAFAVHASGARTAEEILRSTDITRGGGVPGIQWDLKILAYDEDTGENMRRITVKAAGDNSLGETTFPPRAAGGRLLQLSRNMWYGSPNIQKPVSISSRQKVMGPAAYGDIASTNYAKDYDAKILREDSLDGDPVYVLELTAKSRIVTYDKIHYWVSKSKLVPVKAEFYTVSGKLFKVATFETKNRIAFGGKNHPFISKMILRDSYDKNHYSVLEYSNVKVTTFPMSIFSVANLNR